MKPAGNETKPRPFTPVSLSPVASPTHDVCKIPPRGQGPVGGPSKTPAQLDRQAVSRGQAPSPESSRPTAALKLRKKSSSEVPERPSRVKKPVREEGSPLQTHPDSWLNVERCPHLGLIRHPSSASQLFPSTERRETALLGRYSRVHDGRASIGISTDAQWGCLPSSTAV